jgi:ABC-type multidrug transport system fused ATPase/permease subunit
LQEYWKQELSLPENRRSVARAMRRATGTGRLLTAILLYGVYAASQFGPVMLLNTLVNYFEGIVSLSTAVLWILVALFLVIPIVGSTCSAHALVLFQHLAVNLRSGLCATLYKKSLRLGSSSKEGVFYGSCAELSAHTSNAATSSGQIVNVMSNDTGQILRLFQFLPSLIWAPVQIIVALYLVYRQVGEAVFVGVGYMFVLIPVNLVLFSVIGRVCCLTRYVYGVMSYSCTAKLRRQNLGFSDKRVKLMNELLTGIRIIKYYAW